MARHAKRRRSGFVVAAVFLSALGLQTLSPTPESSLALNPGIKPFSCEPAFYQFSNGAFYKYNVAPDGGVEPFFELIGGADASPPTASSNASASATTLLDGTGLDLGDIPEVNGTGYNSADNYFYTTAGSKLYRVGLRTDDSGEAVAELVGTIDTSGNGSFVNTAADFVAENKLLLAANSNFGILDINTLELDDFEISGSWSPADFTAVVNDAGLTTSIYGMASKKLFRLDFGADGPLVGSTPTVSEASVRLANSQSARLDDATGWGSAYSDAGGNLFFYSNNTGEVYRIDNSEVQAFEAGTKTSNLTINLVSTATKLLETANDGASCPTATNPYAEPIAVPDVYAFTEGPTFTTKGPPTGLVAEDSAGVDVVVKSVTFGGTTLYRGDITNPGTVSESYPGDFETPGNNNATLTSGSATITIVDWNTGEFSVAGITGGSVQFDYNVIETRTVFGETSPRTSNTAKVSIRALTIEDKTVQPAKQYLDYNTYSGGTTFTAQGKEALQSYFWRIAPTVVNDGLPAGMSISPSTGAIGGTPIGPPLSADTNYTFTVEVGLDPAFKTSVTRSFTIKVEQPDEFALSYNSNIDSIPLSESNRVVTGATPSTSSVSQISVAANPFSMDRYTFDSWNTQSDGNGTAYAPGATITLTQDQTLYAIWSEKSFTVEFDGQGNTAGQVPGDIVGHDIHVPGNSGSLAKSIGGVTYSFGGWSSGPSNSGTLYLNGETFRPNSNSTLYAFWELTTHTLSFGSNNADSGTIPPSVTGTTVLIPGPGDLAREGFTFGGWNTQSDGGGQNYAESQSLNLLSWGSDLVLYARWLPDVESPAPPSSPRPYEGPMIISFSPKDLTSNVEAIVTLSGVRLENVSGIWLCGVQTEIISKSLNSIEISTPPFAEVGLCDAEIRSPSGVLRVINAIKVIEDEQVSDEPSGPPLPSIETSGASVEMTFYPFANGLSKMTPKMSGDIRAFINKHRDRIESITCIGQTEGPTILQVDFHLSERRGQVGCNVARQLVDESVIVLVSSNQVREVGDQLRNVRIILELASDELVSDSTSQDLKARKEDGLFGQ